MEHQICAMAQTHSAEKKWLKICTSVSRCGKQGGARKAWSFALLLFLFASNLSLFQVYNLIVSFYQI